MADHTNTMLSKFMINTFYDATTRNSFCWKYFGHLIVAERNKKKMVNSNKVYCLACLDGVRQDGEDIPFGSVKIKSYNKTVSTGNLTRHLRDDHDIKDVLGDTNKRKNKETSSAPRSVKSSSAKSTKPKYGKEFLARDLVLWFCKSLLPFDSISDGGMVDFFKKYNIIKADDDIPSQYYLSGSALSEVYESMLSKVKEIISLDAASHFAMAFDLWIDYCDRLNYVTITLHYLTSDFVLETINLGTDRVRVGKTEQNIKEIIDNIKNKFSLDEKTITAVSDTREIVNQAVRLSDMPHHLCLGHGLHNLVTIDGIKLVPEIEAIIQKCISIVKALTFAAPELQSEDEEAQLQQEFLDSLDVLAKAIKNDERDPISHENLSDFDSINKTEVQNWALAAEDHKHIPTMQTATPTRWHIVLEILEGVVNVRNPDLINNLLGLISQDEFKITLIEWILLEELVKFLRRFREAVLLLSQKACSINIALVFRSEIIDILNTVDVFDSLILVRLKHNMLANVDKRFPVSKAMVAAALLDNRFISLKEVDVFLEKINTNRTTFLSSYLKEIVDMNNIPTSLIETSCVKNEEDDISLEHKFSKKHSPNVCGEVQVDPVKQECWRYIAAADPSEPKDGDLLSYWNSKKQAFPYLSALARVLLCVPAICMTSEKMFTLDGLKITEKKCRLDPLRLNKILFIHDNYKLCETSV